MDGRQRWIGEWVHNTDAIRDGQERERAQHDSGRRTTTPIEHKDQHQGKRKGDGKNFNELESEKKRREREREREREIHRTN